jgi:hypothetical protein
LAVCPLFQVMRLNFIPTLRFDVCTYIVKRFFRQEIYFQNLLFVGNCWPIFIRLSQPQPFYTTGKYGHILGYIAVSVLWGALVFLFSGLF